MHLCSDYRREVDAHKFIDGALKINGATFTSEHDEPLEGFENKPWIKVADTVEAMQKVGTFYRNRMNLPVVAVTGSVGKTTTREMISTVLASQKKGFSDNWKPEQPDWCSFNTFSFDQRG